MELRQAMMERRSIRGFKDVPIPKEVIRDILQTATRAVSANNNQPWEFAVVTGEVLRKIGAANVQSFVDGVTPDYEDTEFEGIYRRRQIDVAKQLFGAMEIAREDKEKRHQWLQRGFRFFDAPVAIILYMDESLRESAARFDMGCVAQSICLAAMEQGIGTCVEDQAINYQQVLRQELGITETKRFVTGIAMGYPDWEFPANHVVSAREDLDNITSWYGFE